GGQNLNIKRGPYDQREVENRDDVIVFSTNVLSDSVWIAGPVKARLFVSSDCVDTDFTVKLTDVYPDGRSMLITDSVIRMRNRNGCDHWEFMNPGKIYEVEIDLWNTAYLFNEGHQIRVSVSSSNSPRFLPNPNTGDGWLKNESYQIAENTVYVGKEYPSQIVLPVVSLNYEKEVKQSSAKILQLKQDFLQAHPVFQSMDAGFNQHLLKMN
ncbi:MAG: CocE/NonD family hydrolase, partial [Candidatus Thermoplasmatota archaeon]|nr:CocE/NonD family hydrolase [Candidatus Thermoplasmatota archaeon]